MTENIWNQFKDELLRFILSRVKDKDIAHDLLQDVFVKIHSKSDSLSDNDKLTSWIYQITRNTIIDYYRKRGTQKKEQEILQYIPESDNSFNHELFCCLIPFIDELPEKYKDALINTSYGSLSQKEYAEQLNLSYSATKSRIQRARSQLKDTFVKCCAIESDKYGNIIEVKKKNCDCD